jgi:hypothetical protein
MATVAAMMMRDRILNWQKERATQDAVKREAMRQSREFYVSLGLGGVRPILCAFYNTARQEQSTAPSVWLRSRGR